MPQVNKQEKKEYKKVIVEGIAMYASVHKPKKPYAEGDIPAYTLDLILTDEEAAKLEAHGLKRSKVKVDEDTKKPKEYATHPGMKVFQFRRKTHKRGEAPGLWGEARATLRVVDAQNSPVPSNVLVGNGSTVRVSVNPYTMNIKGKEITGHDLLAVQVLKLVKYKVRQDGPTNEFEAVKGGYVATQNQPTDSEDDPFSDN